MDDDLPTLGPGVRVRIIFDETDQYGMEGLILSVDSKGPEPLFRVNVGIGRPMLSWLTEDLEVIE